MSRPTSRKKKGTNTAYDDDYLDELSFGMKRARVDDDEPVASTSPQPEAESSASASASTSASKHSRTDPRELLDPRTLTILSQLYSMPALFEKMITQVRGTDSLLFFNDAYEYFGMMRGVYLQLDKYERMETSPMQLFWRMLGVGALKANQHPVLGWKALFEPCRVYIDDFWYVFRRTSGLTIENLSQAIEAITREGRRVSGRPGFSGASVSFAQRTLPNALEVEFNELTEPALKKEPDHYYSYWSRLVRVRELLASSGLFRLIVGGALSIARGKDLERDKFFQPFNTLYHAFKIIAFLQVLQNQGGFHTICTYDALSRVFNGEFKLFMFPLSEEQQDLLVTHVEHLIKDELLDKKEDQVAASLVLLPPRYKDLKQSSDGHHEEGRLYFGRLDLGSYWERHERVDNTQFTVVVNANETPDTLYSLFVDSRPGALHDFIYKSLGMPDRPATNAQALFNEMQSLRAHMLGYSDVFSGRQLGEGRENDFQQRRVMVLSSTDELDELFVRIYEDTTRVDNEPYLNVRGDSLEQLARERGWTDSHYFFPLALRLVGANPHTQLRVFPRINFY